MEIKHAIQGIIYNDSPDTKGYAHCGLEWSSTETIALAAKRIKDWFSNSIQLEYLDISKCNINHPTLEPSQQVKSDNLLLLLLLIDGQSRIPKQLNIHQLPNTIEAEVETKT